jgi:hypothetical protein
MSAERISRAERSGSWRLWVGVLTGPAAWSTQILINYNLEEIACGPASGTTGRILGVDVQAWILGVDTFLAVATLVAGWISIVCLRSTEADASTGGRARWMALSGVMVSALFLIIIVAGFAPPLFLNVCEPTP